MSLSESEVSEDFVMSLVNAEHEFSENRQPVEFKRIFKGYKRAYPQFAKVIQRDYKSWLYDRCESGEEAPS